MSRAEGIRLNGLADWHRCPALVVGLTVHGLAIARALSRRGIAVHCLSDVEASLQPTVYTRYAKVHFRRGLNTGPLRDYLLDVAAEIGASEKIVLFPTSDRIAKAIARSWADLRDHYQLSWASCRDLVVELQRKDMLAKYCDEANVEYPKSAVIARAEDIQAIAAKLRFPIVVKPAQPLSSFKAIKVSAVSELGGVVARYANELPFVCQEWIEGPEPSLYACTTYLDRGRALFMFTSRKLAASPPRVGQGTVFETVDNDEIRDIAARFLSRLDLSGPVAVEFKRDAAGRYWFIEPNVGRTEYCVDLAIQSGFDLPYLEYLHTVGGSVDAAIPTRTTGAVWFDTDKDPNCYLANRHALRGPDGRKRRAVFPYLGHQDWKPFLASFLQLAIIPLAGVGRRVSRALSPSKA